MKEILSKRNKNLNGGLARRSLAEGFTLVETLVALSIFTMSILSILAILSQGISETNYSKKNIIATYLAQEGIEYVRNLRDTYTLFNPTDSETGWGDFLSALAAASCQSARGCYFDDRDLDYTANIQPILKMEIDTCPSSGCPELSYDSSIGKYGFVGDVNSGFVRQINIEIVTHEEDEIGEVNEIKVFSTVYWSQGSGNYSVTLSDNLFNWTE